MNTEIFGFIAGSLTAVSLLPQLIKSWKTKSTKDISIIWSFISISGQIMWIVYGIVITSYSLIIMSALTLSMALSILHLKIRYG